MKKGRAKSFWRWIDFFINSNDFNNSSLFIS